MFNLSQSVCGDTDWGWWCLGVNGYRLARSRVCRNIDWRVPRACVPTGTLTFTS
jgi:hypothetical protein